MKKGLRGLTKIYEEPVKVSKDCDLLTECIKKAKNSGVKDKFAYTKESIALAMNWSISTFDRVKNGKRNLTLEEKKKLAEYLSISLEDIDSLSNAYYRSIYKEMFGDEPKDMAWVDSYEKHLEGLEYTEAELLLKKQIEKIKLWFKNPKLTLNDQYRLANYIEYYQNIEDSVFDFYLYYSALNEKNKSWVNEQMNRNIIYIEDTFTSKDIFTQLSQYEIMANLTEDIISAKIEYDKKIICQNEKVKQRITEYQNSVLAKKYMDNFEKNWDFKIKSYGSTEKLYKRFWAYTAMTREDWKTLIRFKMLDLADTRRKEFTPQQDIYNRVQEIVNQQIELEKKFDLTEEQNPKDVFVITKDFCILPLDLAETEDINYYK